jgi:hypothetical protein
LVTGEDPNTKPTTEALDINESIIQGIELIYDSRFDRAEELFSDLIERNPRNPAPYFYFAMITWSKMALGFWSPEDVEEYSERIDSAIYIARMEIKRGRADSFTYFYLGGALGFKGRLKLMEQRWVSSYLIAVEAINALKTCREMDPENKDVLLGLGMYDYYTARFSGLLKFLANLFLNKGDRERGLAELHIAADEATYSTIEAKSLLLYIYLYLENDYLKALPLAEELTERFQHHPGHIYNKGINYILLDMDLEYQKTLDLIHLKASQQVSQEKICCWEKRGSYLEAGYWLFNEQYGKAREKFEAILRNQDPLNNPYMIAWPMLKIGMSYELEGDKQKAIEYYELVTKMENGAGAQFLAKKYIEDPIEKKSPFLLF